MNENKIVYKHGLQLVCRRGNLKQSKKQDSTECSSRSLKCSGHFVNKNRPF